ncbi:DegT/DnrJ/EryC1/StrS family aminotransferase [Desulforudis sp. 1088]|uniref:DegT/DnrJ/EryC1/StrS family aminotransferase n=3 Tax=Candidatus Desulforudis TaxID=471826 RepID=UPI00347B7FCC
MTLAVDGGTPVRSDFLDPYGPYCAESDLDAIRTVLAAGCRREGAFVRQLEETVAEMTGARFAIALANHAAAMHAALYAAGLAKGDEAAVPSLASPATSHGAVYLGGKCVFCDIDPGTFGLDATDLAQKLGPGCKAVIPVHLAGHPCDLKPVLSLAEERALTVIEDATQALGALYEGRPVGTFGHMGVLSFGDSSLTPAGGGAVVLTDSEEFRDWLALFRNLGIEHDPRRMLKYEGSWQGEVQELGFDYRLSDIHAALALNRLRDLDRTLARRRAIAAYYNKALADLPGVHLPKPAPFARPAWCSYCILLDREVIPRGRKIVYEALRAENIGVDVPCQPLHMQPFYKWQGNPNYCTLYEPSPAPRAEQVYARILSLPLYPAMTEKDAADVVAAIRKVISHFAAA